MAMHNPLTGYEPKFLDNFHHSHGRQDTTTSDARASFDHSCKHRETCGDGTYNESCPGERDLRTRGLRHSAVQEQDHIRKEAVQKLIRQFETYPNKEALQADLEKDQAFNPFREKSKEMTSSMGNMEYFEMCEITPKVQCHQCITYWTKAIVYRTC